MFEEILEIEGLVPTLIIYIIVGIMMWYLLLNKDTFSWTYKIGFYIFLLPISFLIVNHFRNQ